MILGIISVILNIVFVVILNLDLYTDRAILPDGIEREWHRSPMDRLYVSDKPELFYLQVLLAVISVISSILIVIGIKNNIVKIIQIASVSGSVIMFIIIMVVAGSVHPHY